MMFLCFPGLYMISLVLQEHTEEKKSKLKDTSNNKIRLSYCCHHLKVSKIHIKGEMLIAKGLLKLGTTNDELSENLIETISKI